MKTDDFSWRSWHCGNPNKSWIFTHDGKKISPLMSTKAARDLLLIHNQNVKFLLNHIPPEIEHKEAQ